MRADAIVDPTDRFFSGTGGCDAIIHEAAGPGLNEECSTLFPLEEADAVVTDSYDLINYRYIIHTRGPVYIDGLHDEEKILADCYHNCLEEAKKLDLESVVFPLISSGTFSFPKGRALRIASDTITAFLEDNEMNVFLLVYDKESFDDARKLYADIKDYLERKAARKHATCNYVPRDADAELFYGKSQSRKENRKSEHAYREEKDQQLSEISYSAKIPSFEPDESFSECLARLIKEKDLSDPQVYKKANIDRKHFNHMINKKEYRPKKETVVALAIGMKLNKKETDMLLERAGFVLSGSSKFDLIISYCIRNGIYDIFEINEILFEEDQKLLGC